MKNTTEIIITSAEILEIKRVTKMTITIDTDKVEAFKENFRTLEGSDIYRYFSACDATFKEGSFQTSDCVRDLIEEEIIEDIEILSSISI